MILLTYKFKQNQYFTAYKQARRRDDDIAIVNGAFNVTVCHETASVKDIAMSFGGVAATTVLANDTMMVS